MSKSKGFVNAPDMPTYSVPAPPGSGSKTGTAVAFDRQHGVPRNLLETAPSSGVLKPLFEATRAAGWFDPYNFAQNGVPQPNTPEAAKALGSSYHAGSHPAYSDAAARSPHSEER